MSRVIGGILRLALLPLAAPFLLVLLLVSIFLGVQWVVNAPAQDLVNSEHVPVHVCTGRWNVSRRCWWWWWPRCPICSCVSSRC